MAKFNRGVKIIALVVFFVGGTSVPVNATSSDDLDSICTPPMMVMPLGNSITTGKYSGHDTSEAPGAEADDISYRKDLWDLLDASGYSPDFVGSESNGSAYPFSDPQHEGHNGVTDAYIAQHIYNNGGENWLNLNPPDVVLLHIGTNSPRNPSNVEIILNEINEYEADTGNSVIVIVARIIDWVTPNSIVNTYNNGVQTMVEGRPDFESEVFMVDMEDGAGLDYWLYTDEPPGDMFDNLHPYATGYYKMAVQWKQKIDEVYAFCGSNNAPEVTNPGTQSDFEGEGISLQIDANDIDDDLLNYASMNLPGGLSIHPTTGLISGTISDTASFNSPYDVQVSVSDGKPFGTTTISFTWNVTKFNRPPTIQNPPGDQNDAESDIISLQITATDLHNDTLTYSANGLPPELTIDQDTGLISGSLSYEAADNSPYSVEVIAEDDGNPPLSDTISFTWTVANTNRAPIVDVPENQSNNEGDSIDPPLQVEASDPDGDNLKFEAKDNSLPPGLSIDMDNGAIYGTISYDAVGKEEWKNYDVTIIVTDDDELPESTNVHFVWRVDNVNGAPELVNPGTIISHLGEEVSVQIEANDPDGDTLTFTAEGLPQYLSIDPHSGLISGMLANWAAIDSPYLVRVSVVDDGIPSQGASITFTWIVNEHEVYLPVIIR